MTKPTFHCAVPMMAEFENLPRLLKAVINQSISHWQLWICVNHPAYYHEQTKKHWIIEDNIKTLEYLKKLNHPKIHIIDHASIGNEWSSRKKSGVGMARKVLLDKIMQISAETDWYVSLDADTLIDHTYLEKLSEFQEKDDGRTAYSMPYLHCFDHNLETRRAILRYEIYMRYYLLQLFKIQSPYSFTALGSAITSSVKACKLINGLKPKASGEDFYFLQQIAKVGQVCSPPGPFVYPSGRKSERVVFGTGPAIVKGLRNNWSSYPIYNSAAYREVALCMQNFEAIYKGKGRVNLVEQFFAEELNQANPFEKLTTQHKRLDRFIKACHEKLDGLRILQFLRYYENLHPSNELKNLQDILPELNFEGSLHELPIDHLQKINDKLFKTEMLARSAEISLD
ncbi:MAG: glycosyltransferase family 2 protein [Lentisphaeria bacterium]|nr:glycosyltransferase family 2 protein [Lentisphaeria bacterium]